MKNVMVVGGAGFIGSNLCETLLDSCDKVVAIDNFLRGKEENIAPLLANPKFVFMQHDVNDVLGTISLLREHQITHVMHLAANSDIQASAEVPTIEFVNTASTTWSVLAAMKKAGVKNLFFASTSAVYGSSTTGEPFKEDDQMNPISYYGGAKMASEAFIHSYAYMDDLNVLIFRFPNVIGPHLTHGVFFDFYKRLTADPHHLQVLGDGHQSKPYMHSSDLIRGICSLFWDNRGLNVYNIGVEGTTSVRSIVEMFAQELHLKDLKVTYGESKCGWKGDVPKFQYSLSKIHSTGWKASMDSDEACRLTIRDLLKQN